MYEIKSHYSAQELVELKLNGLPTSKKGILNKAKKEKWASKARVGKGGGFEYHINNLPPEAQQELRLRHARSLVQAQPKPTQEASPALWQPFEQANSTQKAKAEQKYLAVSAVQQLIESQVPLMQALEMVSTAQNVAIGSLKNWYYKVRSFDQSEWLAVLLKRTGKVEKSKAVFEQEAWEVFLADYLRLEQPSFTACYERLKRAAKEMGWTIPSKGSALRRYKTEVPFEVEVLKRKGENALMQLVPSLRRSVADLQAMEWLNGDGYQHNVFVRWTNGEIVRPKTWFWQCVRTRKILGYRCDVSENSDSIRYALMDVIAKYGIPRHITIDNTRAAANKWLTGGVANRYRFKVMPDDPKAWHTTALDKRSRRQRTRTSQTDRTSLLTRWCRRVGR